VAFGGEEVDLNFAALAAAPGWGQERCTFSCVSQQLNTSACSQGPLPRKQRATTPLRPWTNRCPSSSRAIIVARINAFLLGRSEVREVPPPPL
jgi:hypothetical protein